MSGDVSTIGAPVMLIGLLIGFFLCFYGYIIKQLYVSLRSVLSGATVFLAAAVLVLDWTQLGSTLSTSQPMHALYELLYDPTDSLTFIVYLLSISLGALMLFALARIKSRLAEFFVSICTALSMALFMLLLSLSYLPLQASLIVSGTSLVIILPFCISRFASYLAMETAILGSLLVSYMLCRFWYLGFLIFLFIWALLAFLGITNQLHRLKVRDKAVGEAHE